MQLEKATKRHMLLQDRLAEELRRHGVEPRSPNPLEPQYDLAFEHEGSSFVVEAKTGDPPTAQQLRIGTGQVIEYRHRMTAARGRNATAIRPLLLLESQPPDPWSTLSRELGIGIVDASDLTGSLSRLLAFGAHS